MCNFFFSKNLLNNLLLKCIAIPLKASLLLKQDVLQCRITSSPSKSGFSFLYCVINSNKSLHKYFSIACSGDLD